MSGKGKGKISMEEMRRLVDGPIDAIRGAKFLFEGVLEKLIELEPIFAESLGVKQKRVPTGKSVKVFLVELSDGSHKQVRYDSEFWEDSMGHHVRIYEQRGRQQIYDTDLERWYR